MRFKIISAPGKLILSGEHAVVYGYPAIAAAIDRRLTIFNDGRIKSSVPIGAGMGSSASFAVATSAMKLGRLDLEEINKSAYEMEKLRHGKPSGVDNTVVTYGGFLWYRKESESFKTFKQIEAKVKLPKLFLLNSGKPKETTKEMVSLVAERYKRNKKQVDAVFRQMEVITKNFLKFLLKEDNSLEFSSLMRDNEKLLEELGVVSESTKDIVRKIEKIGGVAKVAGAGGRKSGSGMVILYHKDVEGISLIQEKYNLDISPVKLGEEGVKIEK